MTAVPYPITLELRYKTGHSAPLAGIGRTSQMSNREVVFTAEHLLEPGTQMEIFIAWPAVLHDRVRLQLVVDGEVIRRHGVMLTAVIRRHHFRTRGSSDPRPPAPRPAATSPVLQARLENSLAAPISWQYARRTNLGSG